MRTPARRWVVRIVAAACTSLLVWPAAVAATDAAPTSASRTNAVLQAPDPSPTSSPDPANLVTNTFGVLPATGPGTLRVILGIALALIATGLALGALLLRGRSHEAT